MQYKNKEYDESKHERWPALAVKQPYANYMITESRKENGHTYAIKSVEIRSRYTTFRGDLLICSSAQPVFPNMESGAALGIINLYDVKKIQDLTPEEWRQTCIPEEERKGLKGYGYFLRDPRRVVEIPARGQLGIFNYVCDKGDIVEYPRVIVIDKKGRQIINKQINKK